ncbi:MAG: DUF4411 family protein [SAR324 cluster bacterium]|nr:DUF4411 family protein [SAR324 cluster bacterium]
MIYIFDSNSLIDLFKNFYFKRFPSLWEKFDQAVDEKQIISVREVIHEIGNRGDRLSDWSKEHRTLFQQPTPDELIFVTEIFKVPHFQSMVRKKERLLGKPVADPFVIAKAKVMEACVITQENNKPNSSRIPNVCEYFKIECSNLEGFMEQENWIF